MVDEQYIMWLMNIAGMTSKKARIIIDFFGSAEGVYHCGRNMLMQVPDMTAQLAQSIADSQNDDFLNGLILRLIDKNIRFISYNSKYYPFLLKNIFDPPVGLYISGQMPDERLPKIAVIGARLCTEYGLTAAEKLSFELARNGLVIVSGMARGIDSAAHRGAIAAGGYTIAVLGCGADVCYPPENSLLMKEITQNGCVISEYPLGTKPQKHYFPERNRIISGLCEAVAVVEAESKSGTNITVTQALEQGRDVFAVPGSIFSKYSQGTNELIKNGAIPLTSCEDVLWELKSRRRHNINGENDISDKTPGNSTRNLSDINEDKIKSTLAPKEKLVYDCLSLEPTQTDSLINSLGMPAQELQFILTKLEIKGCVRKLAGNRFIRRESR